MPRSSKLPSNISCYTHILTTFWNVTLPNFEMGTEVSKKNYDLFLGGPEDRCNRGSRPAGRISDRRRCKILRFHLSNACCIFSSLVPHRFAHRTLPIHYCYMSSAHKYCDSL